MCYYYRSRGALGQGKPDIEIRVTSFVTIKQDSQRGGQQRSLEGIPPKTLNQYLTRTTIDGGGGQQAEFMSRPPTLA